MFVSSISFCGAKIFSLKKAAKAAEQQAKEIPTESELMNKITKYWKMIDEDPLSMGWFNKLYQTEDMLKKYYPEAYKNYKENFKLH